MFTFFGLFADPATDLPQRIAEAWPDLKLTRLEHPISAVAVRFNEDDQNRLGEGILPPDVLRTIELISVEVPANRFLLLRTECFGGICHNWGRIIQDGRTLFEAEGDGALRRLIGHWGVDIGPQEIFEPLSRSFKWD